MNLNDLYEMRDPRDAYQRDVDNSTSGFGKNSQAYRADGGANDERHDLDPTEWYIVKDGKMFKATVYPNQEQQAISQGYSRTRDDAKAKVGKQGMAESVEDRTSYQVAKVLFDRGITYDPTREDALIKVIGMVLVKELNMSPKMAQGVMNNEDFLGDTMGELKHMEQSMAEGWKGALAGGLAGAALGSVAPGFGTLAGAAAGAYAGHKMGDEGFKDPDAEYKKAQKLKQQQNKDVTEGDDYSAVTGAITRRIITQHPEVLAKYGPAIVSQAIDEIADFVGDVDEIGSSDVSGWVRQVIQSLGRFAPVRDEGIAEGHTEVKDKQGKVVSWKDDSEWHRAEKNKQGQPKDPRGVVTHLSDVARRKTADQQGVAEAQQLSVQQLATISDAVLDKAYGYGRSQPSNSFGWQANLKSAAFAKQIIDKGVTDIEAISDAIHKGWNTTAQAFVQNPEQFDDTAKLKAAGKLEAKLQQRAQLMKQNYGQLPEEEKEKDRVVARALLQALKGEQDMAEGWKEKVAAATLAGTMALGAAGAGATGLPGGSSSVDQSAGKPVATQVAPTDAGFINRVQAQHRAMEQMNPQYAKDHAGLNIAMVRGIGGGSDVKNQQWAQKTAQLLQKYGAQVKEDIATQDSGEYDYEGSLTEDLQADDGEYYSNSAKFFGQFEADHFDNEETSPDGMEIRGYIDGANVMAWRFKSAKKVGGWGIYDDSALEQGVSEAEVDSNGYSMDHADSGEYDYEGDQAKDQLNTIVRAARKLNGLLDDNENMPEWVQMKITNAADYIDTAADYIESNQEPELAEGNRKPEPPEADYGDDYQQMVLRLKKLAGAGPLKTVYHPASRVYRNVPVAVQPKK